MNPENRHGTHTPPLPGAVAAQRTIAVVGDLWSLRILRTMFRGKRRHGDFVTELGISRAVLSDRLRRLVHHGVLTRSAAAGRHPEYRLSERGLDLWSLFLAMWQWESDWGTARDPDSWAPDRPRAQVHHVACGRSMRPDLRCQACNTVVLPFETRAVPAPTPDQRDVAERSSDSGTAGADRAITDPAGMAALPQTAAFRRGRGDSRERTSGLARVLGDRWSAALVAAAFRGTCQFAQLRQQLGIGPAQLSERLADLQAMGILRARPYAGSRQEYRLTRAGIALFPMTLELLRWGNRWLAGPDEGYPVEHLPCGHELHVRWHCDQCGDVLTRDAVRFG